MPLKAFIDQDYLKSILDYSPETGEFIWKRRSLRPGFERTDKGWNKRRAGTIAGTINFAGYATINLLGIPRYCHRLAFIWMTGTAPDIIDHIDLKKANNAWANLRPTTLQGNSANRGIRKDNTSGYKGVSWTAATQRWAAQIHVDGKHIFLGYFDDKDTAARAYETAASQFFGEFARVS